jgi:hypothetical protein
MQYLIFITKKRKRVMKKLILFSLCWAIASNIQIALANVNRLTNNDTDDYDIRTGCAYNQFLNCPDYDVANENNRDQFNVPNFAAMFTKTLDHDPITGVASTTGQQNFQILVNATENGQQTTYNSITRHSGASKFVNPQASAACNLMGRDSSAIPMPMVPTLDSEWAGADMAEVYLQAIARNVSFSDYGTGTGTDIDSINGGSITQNACKVLNAFGSAYHGPKDSGSVTPAVLFRGTSNGCLVGPYLSQFILQDLHRINQKLLPEKQLVPIASNREFGITWNNFVTIQNGLIPVPYSPSDFGSLRYTINGRDLGTSVHNDLPTDFWMQCFNILYNNGFPQAPNLPYFNGAMPNEKPFITMGGPDIVAQISAVSRLALQNAWAIKWRATRRLRPEAMAGLIHQKVVTEQNPYSLDKTIFGTLGGINLMNWVRSYNLSQLPYNQDNDTYLLALMYPEGCPAHPSYPSGHAIVAGACSTVIKAFMDDQVLFKDYLTPMVPDPNNPTELIPLADGSENLLTVGGELEKLASNIPLGRDFAGVHYRSDCDYGVAIGEAIAIEFLKDLAATYAEQGFTGFELNKRNGVRIRITANGVTVI